MRLNDKKILVGISGSIAAYKTAELIRQLVKLGADVRVMMTPSATDFITPLTLSTLSNNPVGIAYSNKDTGQWNNHVEWAHWADAIVLAPLTLNTLSKWATGICDNFLLATCFSAECPMFFCPAMDREMYQYPKVNEYIEQLQSFGHHLIDSEFGELASGLQGKGRMAEPEQIISVVLNYFIRGKVLSGKTVLVNAGPTHEPIDAVRFIGNRSTGKMGIAIAKYCQSLGAEVQLVLGPSTETVPPNITVHKVTTAQEMYEKCTTIFPHCNVAVLSAAVADFTVASPAQNKIKKEGGVPSFELSPTKDILKSLGSLKNENQVLVGFALETDDENTNAKAKLKNKNADFIVLNSLNDPGSGFGFNTNKVTIFGAKGQVKEFELNAKEIIARNIIDYVLENSST